MNRTTLHNQLYRQSTMGAVLAMGGVGLLRGDPLKYAWGFRRKQLRRHARQEWFGGLSYFVGGQGKPVVFIHGFSDHAGSWADTVALLREKCRVIVIELPGHGESAVPDTYDFETVYAGLESLLNLLIPEHERAIFVGNSMGGWLAMMDALRYPQRAEHLVLLNSAGIAYELDADLLMPTSREQMQQKLKAILGPKRMPAILPGPFLDALMTLTTPYLKTMYDHLTEEDCLDETQLSHLNTPTTVLWGMQDQILPSDYASQFFRALPQAKIIKKRDWAHSAQMSHPGQLAQTLDYILAPYTRSYRVG